MNTMWKSKELIDKDSYALRYKLADVALQHAISTKSNRSLYAALSHLSMVGSLEIPLYKFEGLYYQRLLPYDYDVEKYCLEKLNTLRRQIRGYLC